jgi:Spy/CpxP family protein refolding chaperone
MKSKFASWSNVAAAALLALGAHAAMAQPGPRGPGGHGGHGGMDIDHMIASAKAQLDLNTSQQVMFDNAVAASKAARATARQNMEQVHTMLNNELTKAEPDLAAVAAAADAAQANTQALRKQVRDQWLALYATFTPSQKAVVRDNIKARVARMEAFREKMRERFQSRQGTNG